MPRTLRASRACLSVPCVLDPAPRSWPAPCGAAAAESLPSEDQSFDAAMAFSTVHHWQDPIAGLREMRRVARRVVVFTFDASEFGWRRRFWLTRDYLPEVAGLVAGWSLAPHQPTFAPRCTMRWGHGDRLRRAARTALHRPVSLSSTAHTPGA
jgi:SAM-dependent methyltransferase